MIRQRYSIIGVTAVCTVLLISGCGGAPHAANDHTPPDPTAAVRSAADGRAVIAIDGMACPFCTYNVQRQLETVDGVERADVSLERGEAYVTLSEQNAPTEQQLREAVASSGFTATEVRMP